MERGDSNALKDLPVLPLGSGTILKPGTVLNLSIKYYFHWCWNWLRIQEHVSRSLIWVCVLFLCYYDVYIYFAKKGLKIGFWPRNSDNFYISLFLLSRCRYLFTSCNSEYAGYPSLHTARIELAVSDTHLHSGQEVSHKRINGIHKCKSHNTKGKSTQRKHIHKVWETTDVDNVTSSYLLL